MTPKIAYACTVLIINGFPSQPSSADSRGKNPYCFCSGFFFFNADRTVVVFYDTHTLLEFSASCPANATLCRVKVRFVVMMQSGQAAGAYAAHVSTWFFSVYITSLPRVVVGKSTCRVPG